MMTNSCRRRRGTTRMTLPGRCDLLAGFSTLTLLLLLLLPAQAHTLPEFLSIDCGASEQYHDRVTGLSWTPDTRYVRAGTTSSAVGGASSLPARFQTLRFFSGNQSKWCYDLPATNGSTYLLRATFLYGNYDGMARAPGFKVQVDTVAVGEVRYGEESKAIEVVMVAAEQSIYLCLAPNSFGTGGDVPYVNFIELRHMGDAMYRKARQGYMMVTEYRYNFGGSNASYPIDEYDRHWEGFSPARARVVKSTQNVSVTETGAPDNAPMEVMMTAVVFPMEAPHDLPLRVAGGRNYVVLLWLAEIEKLEAPGRREFQVAIDEDSQDAIDEDWQEKIDVVAATGHAYRTYEWGYPSVTLEADSRIAFRATNTSSQGPLVNAMEVYAMSDPVLPKTNVGDVAGIEIIRTHWNLTSWCGDPCLSIPFDWTKCSADTIPRVTMLNFGGYNLTGSIPDAGIQNLTELTVLSLENNALTGTVPEMSALTKLQKLHLQNNDLSGEFPVWVADLPALTELFMEGNNFSGDIPPSLFNRPGLTFTYGSSSAGLTASAASAPSSDSTRTIGIITGCVVAALSLVVLIISVALFLLWRKPKKKEREYWRSNDFGSVMDSKAQTMAYSFNEVKAATHNFQDLLEEGSYGPVYKGVLSDGREVAVKRCRPSNRQGALEFFDEVQRLSRIHHRNLAAFVGYCQESQEQILLYEYISNSDPHTHLHGNGRALLWRTRLNIALGAAQGLEYLHTGCSPSIVHRDVKPANILLTSRMVAKVANFGFAKFTGEQDPALEAHSCDVKGTAGYLDPEYLSTRKLTEKSDVYGFGVVLLELISGQEVICSDESERDPLLMDWMRPLLGAGQLKAVVDPSLGDKYNLECMWKMAELGMMCVKPKSSNRPTITDVVKEIHDAIALEEAGPMQASPMSPFALSTPSPHGRLVSARD